MADLKLEDIVAFFQGTGPDKVKQLFDELKQKSTNFNTAFASSMKDVKTNVQSVGTEVEKTGNTVSAVTEKMKTSGLDEFIDTVSNGITKFAENNSKLVGLVGQFGLLRAAMTKLPEPAAFTTIGTNADIAVNKIENTINTVNKLFNIKPGSDGIIDKFVIGAGETLKLAEPAKKFEASFLSAASASGQFGEVIASVGPNLQGLSLINERFSSVIQEVGNSSGLSSSQVAEYAGSLLKIPGALDQNISSLDGTNQNLSLLDASLKLATGTGQSFEKVFNDMNDMYRNFGITGKEALEYTARLSEASQKLRMPLEIVRGVASQAAEGFSMLGNNAQGAISILARMGPALQNSGLGPAAISNLVKGVVDSIGRLNIAQKSFLSSQTGGPGGLQGGYQVDLMLRQGKVDEVYSKVEQSLRKQFGGRIVSLEEAASNQGAAAQFTKQVQMLTSGPTAIAKSESEAYRLLEAFSKGVSPEAEIKTGEDALKDSVDVGNKIQDRQYNVLVRLQNEAERASQLAAISAFNLSRLVVGTDGSREFTDILRRDRAESSANAARLTSGTPGKDIPLGKKVGDVVAEDLASLPEKMSKNLELAKSFFKNILGESSDAAAEIYGQAMAGSMLGTSNLTPEAQKIIDNQSKGVSPEAQNKLNRPTPEIASPEARVSTALNRQEQIQARAPVGGGGGGRTQEEVSLTIKPLCGKCLDHMPTEDKVIKIVDNKIISADSAKTTALQTGVAQMA